jgi:hypothetical protein
VREWEKFQFKYTVLEISQLKAIWPKGSHENNFVYMCIVLTLVYTLIGFVLHGPCKVPFE